MSNTTDYCYLNGKIVPTNEAFVSIFDTGILRGYGVYDGATVFKKNIFRFEDHLKRLENSAALIGLKVPLSPEEIKSTMQELVSKNNYNRTNLRTILTGGDAIDGIFPTPNKPTFFIVSEEWQALPQNLYTEGAKLITHEHERYLPEAKTTNYIEAVKLQPLRKSSGAIEILFVNNGQVLECATSNVFAFIGDVLVTPYRNILGGITRKVVLEIAQGHFKTEERDLSVSELFDADEVFITSSYKDIVPIVTIDDKSVGQGKVGEKTKDLIALFEGCIK